MDYIRAKETFIKRYRAGRTNKAEIRPEEQSEKAESCQENLWKEIQLKTKQTPNSSYQADGNITFHLFTTDKRIFKQAICTD